MKIICVGRNYVAHIAELNNEIPEELVLFMKPETALCTLTDNFYLPTFSEEVHFETELVLKICKGGKNIEPEFAHRYFEEVSLGIDFTARDLQSKLKQKGLPWEKAKSFDNSAVVGKFIPKEGLDFKHLKYHLILNGNVQQEGDTALMIHPIDKIISEISKYFTLKKGDLIYTGTPSGVGPTKSGDFFEAFINNEKLLELKVN